MVVAVDEVASAPAGRLRRGLRRGLLIAALAAAGWLCGALFSTTASAAPAPPTEQQPRGLAGYLGSVTHAVTNAVTHTVTHTVHQADRTAAALTHAVVATPEPAESAGRPVVASPAPVEPSGAERAATAPAPIAPHEPPATPALPVTVAPAAEHPPRAPVDPTSQRASATGVPHGIDGAAVRADQQAEDDARAGRHGPGQPDRSPAPAAPGGTSVYTAHDTHVGARGVLGVLTDSAPRPPPAAGHSPRGSAADATGRVAGLPATAPD
jgi:hypothetical protein